MILRHHPLSVAISWLGLSGILIAAPEVVVRDPTELAAALKVLRPETTLKIGPGEYKGGNAVSNLNGLTIEALDPQSPPIFRGGNQAWHFSRCNGLTVRNLIAIGQSMNGINLDDGGQREQPVTGVTLDRVVVREVGPTGNHDAIKISGLDDLRIQGCEIEGWGGQGIDMVGCHRVIVTGCELKGKEGFAAGAGIQMKGGCSEITIEKCRLTNAGTRPINLGGSTGMPYFRPAGATYEAKDLIVRDNVIEGGDCAAAFVGLDGGEFSGNTILNPNKWIFRILQETRAEGFVPCRNVIVKDNAITFQRSQVKVEVNIGEGTQPETFRFERNHWFAKDQPTASKPELPTEETGGVYGVEPVSKAERR